VFDGADLVASDVNGGGLIRLTQSQGGNADPACSPDGRLVAYFSTRKSGKGPGLYIMPIAAPWRAQRVLDVMGGSLRWEAMLP
jgi:TolB protein